MTAVWSELINPAGARYPASPAQFDKFLTPEVCPLRHQQRLATFGPLRGPFLLVPLPPFVFG